MDRRLFLHTVGIPMGTNSTPLLTNLFLYSGKNEFWDRLLEEGTRKLARKVNLSFRHMEIDDLIVSSNI